MSFSLKSFKICRVWSKAVIFAGGKQPLRGHFGNIFPKIMPLYLAEILLAPSTFHQVSIIVLIHRYL
jgi:hypothetical protein